MKRHPLDVISLVLSILFLAVGLRYIGPGADVGSFPRPGWLLPVGLIALGVGVIASAARARTLPRGDGRDREEPPQRG